MVGNHSNTNRPFLQEIGNCEVQCHGTLGQFGQNGEFEESHHLLQLTVKVSGQSTMCLIDSGATHNFVCQQFLEGISLHVQTDQALEVTLADGSKVTTDRVCSVVVDFGQDIRHVVHCHVVDNLSNNLVLGMAWLTKFNPTIRWSEYEVDLLKGNKVVTLTGQLCDLSVPSVSICSAKVACKAIRNGATAWFLMLRSQDAADLHGVEGTKRSDKPVHG